MPCRSEGTPRRRSGIESKNRNRVSFAYCIKAFTLAYSLYLTHKEVVHWDQVFFLRYVEPGGWMDFLIYFATSFMAATVLYLAIERPFLRLREKITSRSLRPAPKSAAAG